MQTKFNPLSVGDLVELADRIRYVGDIVSIDDSPGLLISFVVYRGETMHFGSDDVLRESLGAPDTALVLWPNGSMTAVNTIFLRKRLEEAK